MRIAISGTHCTGKTTLVEALAERLPKHVAVQEPYWQLEEEGYEFPEMPACEDFEAQLRRSLRSLTEHPGPAIFDRCPVDLVAYALAAPDGDSFDLDEWLPEIQAAMSGLDLVVYLSARSGDRIPVPRGQDDGFRDEVDERIRELLIDNGLGLDVEVIEVAGSVERRVTRVLERAGGAG